MYEGYYSFQAAEVNVFLVLFNKFYQFSIKFISFDQFAFPAGYLQLTFVTVAVVCKHACVCVCVSSCLSI